MVGVSPGAPGKDTQKNFGNLFFEKSIGKCVGCEPSVVPPCRLVYMFAQCEVENVGKNLRLCSGSRKIRKWWAWAPGPRERAPKNLKYVFRKKYRKLCGLRSVRGAAVGIGIYGCAMLVQWSCELWSGRHLELEWSL